MRVDRVEVFDIFRDGKIFRSFPTKGPALAFLAAARELQPDHKFTVNIVYVRTEVRE